MGSIRLPFILVCVILPCIMSTGCGKSAPSRFYLIEPVMVEGENIQREEGERCTSIGVGPIQIPGYLDRQQIVTRSGPNRLDLAEFDKWAEPLEESLSRAIAENLETELCTQPVAIFPWRSSRDVEYHVIMDILRLDGSLGKKAVLHVRWRLLDREGRLIRADRSYYEQQVQDETYQAMAQAMSSLVKDLSRDVGQAITAVIE